MGSAAARALLVVVTLCSCAGRAGTAMNNLGLSYSYLGRHSEALAMRESVLEFYRRVLPADHPDIGEGCEGRDGLHAVR